VRYQTAPLPVATSILRTKPARHAHLAPLHPTRPTPTPILSPCEHTFVQTNPSPDLPPLSQDLTCTRCHEPKPPSAFAWRRKSFAQRDTYCRPCRKAYKQAHYAAHRARYVAAARTRKQLLIAERTAYLLDFFRTHPCTDCGETDPLVLEFDHLADKRFNVAKGLRDRNWQSVLDEIAKCEVVCANCHRRRTARRGGFARAAVAQR
jgi:hypothetical protein